jgi:hypothetical protein
MAVGLMVIGFFYLDLAYTLESLFVVATFDFIAIIMNVVWLILYWSHFWSDDYIDSSTLDGPRRLLVILSFIMIGIEVILLFLLVRIFWFIKRRTTGSRSYATDMQLRGGPAAGGNIYNNAQVLRPGSIDFYTNFQTDGFFIERPMGYTQGAPGQNNMGVPVTGGPSTGNPMPFPQQGAPGAPQTPAGPGQPGQGGPRP